MNEQHIETAKHVGDAVSVFIVVGTIANWLPPLSALVAIIYTLIRIWETKTIQDLIGRDPD